MSSLRKTKIIGKFYLSVKLMEESTKLILFELNKPLGPPPRSLRQPLKTAYEGPRAPQRSTYQGYLGAQSYLPPRHLVECPMHLKGAAIEATQKGTVVAYSSYFGQPKATQGSHFQPPHSLYSKAM